MNTDYTSYSPNPGWQILGELELLVGTSMEDTLTSWLTALLLPLGLQSDLLNKIINSAREAVTRAAQPEIVDELRHIHIVILVSAERTEKDKAWGFFRLEKLEDAGVASTVSEHAVEFYLYRERE